MRNQRAGFTLIELLVVITIIVVLLALLTPALDTALYRADLTVCATNMKALANAATIYAVDHNRAYPDQAERAWPYHLSNPFMGMMAPYMSINRTVNCPFSEMMDYEGSWKRNSAGGIIPPYALWFGWQYTGHTAIRKLGGVMSALDHTDTAKPVVETFSIMASDWDLFYRAGDTRGSHPDYDPNVRHNETAQDQTAPTGGAQDTVAMAANTAPQTYSFWWGFGNGTVRGKFDMTVAWENGSVRTIPAVKPRDSDPRMAFVSPEVKPATNDPVMPLPRED